MNIVLMLIIGSLMIGCVYGLLGMGYSLIYKATGLLNLAQGDFLMIGSFVGLALVKTGIPYVLAIILTFVIMFAFGWCVQLGLVSTLLKKGAAVSYIIILTSAISMILQNGAHSSG